MKKILLLHGAIGAKDQLEDLERLLARDFEVFTLNFSGHGGEETIPVFSIENFADDVLEFLKINNIDRINIFGYSMGGYVALYLAKNHPEKVNAVATLATKFYWDETVAAKETKMLMPEVIEAKLPDFARSLSERHQPQDWKIVLNKTSEMLQALGKRNCLNIEDYKELRLPVTLMLGDRDKMVTLEETLNVYKALPGAALAILPKTPHPIEQADSEMLAWHLTKFIKGTRN